MEKIQIKCTSCGQKFAVSQSYEGRMVECGACESRFRVDQSAIVKEKKRHYPGERSPSNSEAFSKVEGAIPAKAEPNELGFEPANYSKPPNAAQFAPSTAKRTLAVVAGVLLLLLFILIYFLGTRPDGMLKGIGEQKRMILAAFIAVIGSALIIGGARRKPRGIIVAILLSAGLLAFPILIKPVATPATTGSDSGSDSENPEPPKTPKTDLTSQQIYAEAIGFDKVQEIRDKAKAAKLDPTHFKAMVVIDIGAHTDTISEFLRQQLELKNSPVAYTSKRVLNKKYITLLVFNTPVEDEKIIELTKRFGTPSTMDKKLTALQVIEVTVDSTLFTNQDLKILTDQNHPEFFNANLDELNCLEHRRQLSAIKRLAKVSIGLGRQSDISTALASKISVKDETLSNASIDTLRKWALPEYGLDDKIKSYAAEMSKKGNLDQAVMSYLVEHRVPAIADILAEQWLKPEGHLLWNQHMIDAKSEGELALIKALQKNDSSHLKVSASILKKIGTKRALPALRAAAKKASKNDAKYLKDTIDEIKSRS